MLKEFRSAYGGTHQQESALRKGQERNLPGHTSFPVRVVMELVHHHIHNVELFSLVESHVGENLSRAAQNGSVMIYCRITGGKSHVLWPEFLAEGHPFFIYQSLDGARINALASMNKTIEMESQGNHGFSRTRGRVQDDVLAVQKLKNCLFLSRIKHCSAGLRPLHKSL